MHTYAFTDKADEKSSKGFLPSIKEHMINIPSDVQQLTIKDSTVFIGKKHSHRSISICFRRLIFVIVLLAIGMGAIMLQPTLYRIAKRVYMDEMTNSGCNPSRNRNALDTFDVPMANTVRPITSTSSNVITQNQITSAKKQPDITVLYSMRNPYSSLTEFFSFNTVYITRSGQTTLSFLIENDLSTIYIDDVSVNNTYGSPLLVNGNFDNGTYGWQGVSYITSCGTWYIHNSCYSSDYKVGNTLLQTFSSSPGTVLYIGFKLRWSGIGSNMAINITIY